jgi:ribose transport system substrate-binding protein
MYAAERRQAILKLLQESRRVGVSDLAQRFDVSETSIRRDLRDLDRDGLAERIYGGAVLPPDHIEQPPAGKDTPHEHEVTELATRLVLGEALASPEGRTLAESKRAMGRWAADLVADGDAIVLDDSTTAFHLATFLGDRRNLTVVTNGLGAALLLAQNPSNKVILAANHVSPGEASLVGNVNPDVMNGFRASRCFISCVGFSMEHGLSEVDDARALLKSQMIRLAQQTIALIDHTKFGQVSTFRVVGSNRIVHLVTDAGVADSTLNKLRRGASFPITVIGPDSAETYAPLGLLDGRKRYRIGFGNMTERMVFARQVRHSLESAAQALDSVELLVRDNDLDRQKALDNADWFVAQGVDLVVEYQLDAEAANVIMHKFQQAGIPVIAVDIPLPGATFFGADNYRAGRMAGEALGQWIRQHWDGQVDRVLKLECERAGAIGAARLQGQFEGLESVLGTALDRKVVTVDCPVIMQDVPQRVGRLIGEIAPDEKVAIIAINDDAALGSLEVFERTGRANRTAAVGQNLDLLGRAALRRANSSFIGSTSYRPEEYGERLLDLALRILRGEAVSPAVYVGHTFVTRETLDLFYPQETESSAAGLLAAPSAGAGGSR